MGSFYNRENVWVDIHNYDLAAGKWTKSSNLNNWVDAISFDFARVGLEKFYFRSTENFATTSGTASFSFNMQIVDPDGQLVRSIFTSSSTLSSYSLTEVVCKRSIPAGTRLQIQINNAALSTGILEFTFLLQSDAVDSQVRSLI
jgi:hypothetical protein